MRRRALFLDRDGVINRDLGYVHRVEDFHLEPGIFELCRAARGHGFALVVVTNQSGVARGFYDEADLRAVTATMCDHFERAGVPLDAVYACPHHPDGEVARYMARCACRKPEPGMLLTAAEELGLDLGASLLVGDKPSDAEAARRAGLKGAILIGLGGGDSPPPGAVACATLFDALDELQSLAETEGAALPADGPASPTPAATGAPGPMRLR